MHSAQALPLREEQTRQQQADAFAAGSHPFAPAPFRKRGIRPLPPVKASGVVAAAAAKAGTPQTSWPGGIGEPPAVGVSSPNVTDVAAVSPNSFWGAQSARAAPREPERYFQGEGTSDARQVVTPPRDELLSAAPNGKIRRPAVLCCERGEDGLYTGGWAFITSL